MSSTECPWCERAHDDRYLCDTARLVLDGVRARADELRLPTTELSKPVWGTADGLVLLRQIIVRAAVIPIGGIDRPALIFTGQDQGGRQLDRWAYVGTKKQVHETVKLVSDMGQLAIRRAGR